MDPAKSRIQTFAINEHITFALDQVHLRTTLFPASDTKCLSILINDGGRTDDSEWINISFEDLQGLLQIFRDCIGVDPIEPLQDLEDSVILCCSDRLPDEQAILNEGSPSYARSLRWRNSRKGLIAAKECLNPEEMIGAVRTGSKVGRRGGHDAPFGWIYGR